jgi:hypothetical protein
MMLRTKTTAAVLGGAVALASGAYALGSQSGGGSAVAQTSSTSSSTSTKPYGPPGPGGPWRGRDAGLSALAGKLGVSESALRSALDAVKSQLGPKPGDRDKHETDLAKALGVSTPQLEAALNKLRPNGPARDARHDFGLADALAKGLNLDAAKVRSALDALRANGRPSGDPAAALAKALGIDAARLRSALKDLRPVGPGRPGRPDDSAFAADLAKALGLDATKVKAALDKLRTAKEADHQAREDKVAAALAAKLNLDVSKVKDALAALPHHGRHGP